MNRDKVLNELGLKVLRFKNEELENLDSVLKKIRSLIHFENEEG